jgi:hypothetical protein
MAGASVPAAPGLMSMMICWPRILPTALGEQAHVYVGDAAGGERVVDRDRLLGFPACLAAGDPRSDHRSGERGRAGRGGKAAAVDRDLLGHERSSCSFS